MSHYVVLVIGDNPEKQLEPYDGGLRVEPYLSDLVDDADKERFVKYYQTKAWEFLTNIKGMTDLPKDNDYNAWFDLINQYYGEEWNGYGFKRNPDTNEWHEVSTYNPKSKWDWYQLGGRWCGYIPVKEGCGGGWGSPSWSNEEDDTEILVASRLYDIVQSQDIDFESDKFHIPFAVVYNGEWMAKGEMGWFGCSTEDIPREEWANKVTELLKGLPAGTLIHVYDLHI